MKPDESRRVFEGKQISVDVERSRSSGIPARSRSSRSTLMSE